MNTILKNTISITVITLVAGLALGVVQDITAGPIATQAEKSKEEAYKAVFEDASSFSIHSMTPIRPKILLLTLMIMVSQHRQLMKLW